MVKRALVDLKELAHLYNPDWLIENYGEPSQAEIFHDCVVSTTNTLRQKVLTDSEPMSAGSLT